MLFVLVAPTISIGTCFDSAPSELPGSSYMTINDYYTNTYTVWVGDTIQITYQWDYEVTPQCPDDSCIVQLYLGITGNDSMTCENIPQYQLGYQRLNYSAVATEVGCHKIFTLIEYESGCNSNVLSYSPAITIVGALWVYHPSQSKLIFII